MNSWIQWQSSTLDLLSIIIIVERVFFFIMTDYLFLTLGSNVIVILMLSENIHLLYCGNIVPAIQFIGFFTLYYKNSYEGFCSFSCM